MDFNIFKNGPLLAILANLMIGLSLVWDKVLLKNPGTKNLFSYVFWLGSLSVFGVALVPFGYESVAFGIIAIAFGAGALHLVAVFFYYQALKRGEASETLATMGGFAPVATALIALALLSRQMSGHQLIGFAVMTAGGFLMFFSETLRLKNLIVPVLLASGFFGLVNVLEKFVYNRTNFVTGYVWFTIGTFLAAMSLLIRSSWRAQIFAEANQDKPRNRFWYFVNRFVSGVGSFLIFYSISLTHPAVVTAIEGVRYAAIFAGALLLTKLRPSWLRENFRGWQLVTKSVATGLVVSGVIFVGTSGGKASRSATSMNSAPVPQGSLASRSALVLSKRRSRAGPLKPRMGTVHVHFSVH